MSGEEGFLGLGSYFFCTSFFFFFSSWYLLFLAFVFVYRSTTGLRYFVAFSRLPLSPTTLYFTLRPPINFRCMISRRSDVCSLRAKEGSVDVGRGSGLSEGGRVRQTTTANRAQSARRVRPRHRSEDSSSEHASLVYVIK